MPIPTNLTALTAIDLGTLPADITQDVHDTGTALNYTVWYKFTTPLIARVAGAWGFTAIADAYASTIRPYIGPASAPVQILSIAADNKPIQFPVSPATTYFLEFTKNVNTPPASLRVRVEIAPLTQVSKGNILVNDDTPGFPLAVLSQLVDYTVINFVQGIATGEAGDVLTNGTIALEDSNDLTIKLYTFDFSLITTTAVQTGTIRIRCCRGGNKFYVGLSKNPVTVRTLSAIGVFGTTITLTANITLESLAANNAESILYFANIGSGVAIKRWDLISPGALSDLVIGITGYQIPDILVLTDDTILALYYNSGTEDVQVKHYSTTGMTLNTYSLGVQTGSTKPRMAYALDNSNSFWVMTHTSAATGGASIFRNIKVSDGTILTTRNHTEYEGGAMNGIETATPTSRFGNSFSCPFMIAMNNLYSGLYYIVPNKTNDTLLVGIGTIDVKIPNPLIKTGFM